MMIRPAVIIILFISQITGVCFPALAESPPSSIDINIPEYEIEKVDDYDYVDIPGGDILLVDSMPRVPYYPVYINYPEGYRVQDVVMIEVSGLETATGLNLPVVTMEPDFSPDKDFPHLQVEGWYPDEVYNWTAWINSDGSSTLVINVFPFYYNADTTEIKFYRFYRFDIEYITSTIIITGVNADKSVYTIGDEVSLDIGLENTGQAQDVVADITIRQYGTSELVEGLPIRSLISFIGEGSYTATWDTTYADTGDYYAEVSLSDTNGNILDKETVGFSIQLTNIVERPPEIIESLPKPSEKETEVTEELSESTQSSTEFPTLYVIIGAVVFITVAAVLIVYMLRRKHYFTQKEP